jgi:hypothetical protein
VPDFQVGRRRTPYNQMFPILASPSYRFAFSPSSTSRRMASERAGRSGCISSCHAMVSFSIPLRFWRLIVRLDLPVLTECKPDESEHDQDGMQVSARTPNCANSDDGPGAGVKDGNAKATAADIGLTRTDTRSAQNARRRSPSANAHSSWRRAISCPLRLRLVDAAFPVTYSQDPKAYRGASLRP